MTYFNSRPSARGDADQREEDIAHEKFQFTPLREGRPDKTTIAVGESVFQFTPLREGRQSRRPATLPWESISIHAPPRGATDGHPARFRRPVYFNSRPSARGDLADCGNVRHRRAFQFTPLREGRRSIYRSPHANTDFNSRPSARGDAQRFPSKTHPALFQFTPLREGRRFVGRAS